MSLKPYFASSSKVWESVDWVFGIEECGYTGWEISADGNYRLENPKNKAAILDVLGSTHLKATVHAPYADLKRRDERECGWGLGDALAMADVVLENEGAMEEYVQKIGHLLDAIGGCA